MTKLSKQDKIVIYHLWHDYQIGPTALNQYYRVGRSNIDYLLALIDRHGLAILDQPYTTYTSNFKKQALNRIIVDQDPINQVSIDLGLKSSGILHNWLGKYRKNEVTPKFRTNFGGSYQKLLILASLFISIITVKFIQT